MTVSSCFVRRKRVQEIVLHQSRKYWSTIVKCCYSGQNRLCVVILQLISTWSSKMLRTLRERFEKSVGVERLARSMLIWKKKIPNKMHTFQICREVPIVWPCKNQLPPHVPICFILGGSHYSLPYYYFLFFLLFHLENESQNYTKRFIRVFFKDINSAKSSSHLSCSPEFHLICYALFDCYLILMIYNNNNTQNVSVD